MDLHQETRDTRRTYLKVAFSKAKISFWNMSKAIAPIHITETRVK